MSNFVFTKQQLRKILVFCFNWKKSAAEAHRILVEVYGDNAPTENHVGNGFGVSRMVILALNLTQTQEELADTLGVTQQAVFVRSKSMGMIQKQGNWVPYKFRTS